MGGSQEDDDAHLDYCQWEGVECNSTTRRVIKLSLKRTRDRKLDDGYWHLNASILLSFESLRSLGLSGNRLHPVGDEGLGILSNLSNLEELDLRYNGLDNSILLSLNKLSNLKILNLAGNALNGSIYMKDFDGLNNFKELDLSSNRLRRIITVNVSQEEQGILNKLEVLYVSSNFLDNNIWSFLRELSSIKALDLSNNDGLHGAVHNLKKLSSIKNLFMDGIILDNDFLLNIRSMTSIQVLSLRACALNPIHPIEGLCHLKNLRELDTRESGFGGSLPWCLLNLTSLRLLDITSNHFNGNIARSPLINLTSLEYLALSDNDFEIPISFKSFFNHSKLKFIESLNNKLLEEDDTFATSPTFQLIALRLFNSEYGRITRSFPHFLYHQHDLILVELTRTDFTGKFPYWLLYNNTRMETLLPSYNSSDGPLLCPSHSMRELLVLDVSDNHLEGFIPYKISSSFLSLAILKMSRNNFAGKIPSSFGDMTSLKMLDLSDNKLSGEIPVHLAIGCRHLVFLKLSNNNLKGPMLPRQNNMTSLRNLYLDSNGFTEISPSLSQSPLTQLNVSANQLVGKIPRWIGNMSLSFLAIFGNHLEGPIPIEVCQLKDLWGLDLSDNNINGTVPSCFNSSTIRRIRLSKNRLHGPFSMAFQYLPLMELDLSDNQFSGNIPTWIGRLSELTVLLLQNNHFEGTIPNELCHLSSLKLIDLSVNNLFGNIPHCFSKLACKGIPTLTQYESNNIYFSEPTFKASLRDLGMVLKSESQYLNFGCPAIQAAEFETKGTSLSYKGIVLYLFSGINLSHNRLTGPIPPEIGNLSHVKVLNFSHNSLIGTIPATFSNLKSTESLDLSNNHLNGKIPSQLTELNFLEVFNLSYNNLSGRTPQRVAQFATFESSSYIGNPLLCGELLPRKCNATGSPPSTPRATINDTEGDSGFMDTDVFYTSFAGSYVTVVLAIVVILLINPYWRRALFYLVEVFITSYYYFVVDNVVWPRRGFLWK